MHRTGRVRDVITRSKNNQETIGRNIDRRNAPLGQVESIVGEIVSIEGQIKSIGIGDFNPVRRSSKLIFEAGGIAGEKLGNRRWDHWLIDAHRHSRVHTSGTIGRRQNVCRRDRRTHRLASGKSHRTDSLINRHRVGIAHQPR